MRMSFTRAAVVGAALSMFGFATESASANHGPGASGGGSQTISGETLAPGSFEISFREDYTQFQHISQQEAIHRATTSGDFDALDHGFLTSAEVAYGVIENLQVGMSIGYFAGHEFISADNDNGTVDSGTAEPNGLTDLFLTGKYRVLQGQPGNLSVLAGVKFPTGRDDLRLTNGALLSPTDQPGTGAFDFLLGAGYSRFLTSHITVDASALYVFRTEHDDFQVGDRFDASIALAYRITDSIKSFPQWSVFAELTNVFLQEDRDPNTGSNTLYITPGVRVRINPNIAVTLSPSFPVYQQLNGDQGRVDFKVALTVSFSF